MRQPAVRFRNGLFSGTLRHDLRRRHRPGPGSGPGLRHSQGRHRLGGAGGPVRGGPADGGKGLCRHHPHRQLCLSRPVLPDQPPGGAHRPPHRRSLSVPAVRRTGLRRGHRRHFAPGGLYRRHGYRGGDPEQKAGSAHLRHPVRGGRPGTGDPGVFCGHRRPGAVRHPVRAAVLPHSGHGAHLRQEPHPAADHQPGV